MSFDKCIHPCNHHNSRDINILITTKSHLVCLLHDFWMFWTFLKVKNDLRLEPTPFIYKTIYFLHDFNVHLIFQKCNYHVNWGKVVLCSEFYQRFAILENHLRDNSNIICPLSVVFIVVSFTVILHKSTIFLCLL